MIFNRGSIHSGCTLYIQDNRLHFDYHAYDDWFRFQSDGPVPDGEVEIGVSLQSDGRAGRRR